MSCSGRMLAVACGLTLLACGGPPSALPPVSEPWPTVVLRGACDASAIVPLADGSLLVAIDETVDLRTWAPTGAPIATFDLAGPLQALRGSAFDAVAGKLREFDLEAVARVGERLYWIGSHGLGKDGEARPNQRVLFATSVPARGDLRDLKVLSRDRDLSGAFVAAGGVGAASPAVRDALGKAGPILRAAMEGKRLPKDGGVNVEGLARAGERGLWLGFRSPLSPEGEALLARLDNPEEVLRDGVAPRVAEVRWLDLGGRGVRGMEWTGRDYLILAGATGPDEAEGAPVAEVRRWDGRGAATTLVASLPRGFTAEGLAVAGGELLVVSDEGGYPRAVATPGGGQRTLACKALAEEEPGHPQVSFRLLRLPLPPR